MIEDVDRENPYNTFEQRSPFFFTTDSRGEGQLAVREPWYDIAEAVYTHYNRVEEVVTVDGIDLPDISHLIHLYGGIEIKISILLIVIQAAAWAAKECIELVKGELVYKTGFGPVQLTSGRIISGICRTS